MKYFFGIALIWAVCQIIAGTTMQSRKIICYYDMASENHAVEFAEPEWNRAAELCTHIIYGFLDIRPDNFQLQPLLTNQLKHLEGVGKLKEKYPKLKFLLSIGGDKEGTVPETYLQLLKSEKSQQKLFLDSAIEMVKKYNFHGLDLAYRFPKQEDKPSKIAKAVTSIKKALLGAANDIEEKTELIVLATDLSNQLKANGLLFSLTILPNIDTKAYYDVKALQQLIDFVTLFAFDFYTPECSPDYADYISPIEAPPQKSKRKKEYNINYQVTIWTKQNFPSNMINIAVAAYGRSWIMSEKSGQTDLPLKFLKGPADGGALTKKPGFLSYTEICQLLTVKPNPGPRSICEEKLSTGFEQGRQFNNYAFSLSCPKLGKDGIFISFDDPDSAGMKASFVNTRNLGGIALYDLTLDDYSGRCSKDKFPMLSAIKQKLQ